MVEIPDTFQLIPAEAEEIDPDEQIEALGDPDAIATSPVEQEPLGMSWAFNPDTGLVQTYGIQPVAVTGVDALKVWCAVALATSRLTHPIFSDDFGMDEPDHLVGYAFDAERNADYIRDVRSCLLVHDRISDVRNFRFRHDPDDEYVEMDADIVLDDEDLITLEGVRLAYGPA
jgi:hypothetical protein